MRVYSFQCTVPTKSASSMSSLTTKGRVVKTKTGSLTYVHLHDHGCLVVPAGASTSRPTRSTREKEARGDVSVRLPADKGGKSPVKKSASACSTRQKETSGDLSVGLSDSGKDIPVKNGEFSGLCA